MQAFVYGTGRGDEPTDLAWSSGVYTPREYGVDELSYSRTVYDVAGRQIAVITLPGTDDETIAETHYEGTRRDYVIMYKSFAHYYRSCKKALNAFLGHNFR